MTSQSNHVALDDLRENKLFHRAILTLLIQRINTHTDLTRRVGGPSLFYWGVRIRYSFYDPLIAVATPISSRISKGSRSADRRHTQHNSRRETSPDKWLLAALHATSEAKAQQANGRTSAATTGTPPDFPARTAILSRDDPRRKNQVFVKLKGDHCP